MSAANASTPTTGAANTDTANPNAASDAPAIAEPTIGVNGATRSFDDVAVGDTLPALTIALTRTLIVSAAIASRDYQDVHHDAELARQRGSKDIFMNILSTNGLVGRYVTDWAGPGAMLTDVNIRLGAPNYPDDAMALTASVTAKDDAVDADGRGAIEVTLRGANSLGDHVTGTVRLTLPSQTPPPQTPSSGSTPSSTPSSQTPSSGSTPSSTPSSQTPSSQTPSPGSASSGPTSAGPGGEPSTRGAA